MFYRTGYVGGVHCIQEAIKCYTCAMQIDPITTKLLRPPQDNLFAAIRASDLTLADGDVVVISSKVVAVHEGRCVSARDTNKEDLVADEAEVYVKHADHRWRICIKHGAFLAGAGIDESNADEHYILLPAEPQKSARELHQFFVAEYGLDRVGVIITDSHSMPLRYGTLGVALAWHGIEPVAYFTGEPDLFDRPASFTRINVVDSLAATGVFVMGEMAEQSPLALIRDAPNVTFTSRDTSGELTIPPREDIYWPLLRGLYESSGDSA